MNALLHAASIAYASNSPSTGSVPMVDTSTSGSYIASIGAQASSIGNAEALALMGEPLPSDDGGVKSMSLPSLALPRVLFGGNEGIEGLSEGDVADVDRERLEAECVVAGEIYMRASVIESQSKSCVTCPCLGRR